MGTIYKRRERRKRRIFLLARLAYKGAEALECARFSHSPTR